MFRPLLLLTVCFVATSIGQRLKVETAATVEGEAKEPAPDGALYNKTAEDAPLSEPLTRGQAKMTFLGNYLGVEHYIQRSAVSQAAARQGCHAVGMELVAPSSQAHLNFIAAVTASGDDYSWTDGRMFRNMEAFVYDQYCGNNACTPIPEESFDLEFGDRVGLTISRYSKGAKFRTAADTSRHYYICTKGRYL